MIRPPVPGRRTAAMEHHCRQNAVIVIVLAPHEGHTAALYLAGAEAPIPQ